MKDQGYVHKYNIGILLFNLTRQIKSCLYIAEMIFCKVRQAMFYSGLQYMLIILKNEVF